MKTVMKKMFSLLLVAVMLVSVMPFQAFADGEVVCSKDGCPGFNKPATRQPSYDNATCEADGQEGYYCQDGAHIVRGANIPATDHDWDEGTVTKEATCVTYGTKTYTCKNDPSHTKTEQLPAALHTYADATCTAPKKCTVCGNESAPANGHTEVIDAAVAATCTEAGKTEGKHCSVCGEVLLAQQPVTAPGHSYGADNLCTVCKSCKICGKTINAAADHDLSCAHHENYKTRCPECNTDYITANGHPDCEVCKECHTTANCPYCATCYKAGDKNVTSHKASAHCSECGVVSGHKTGCTKAYPATGNAKLYVWADLVVGTSEKQTILLDTIEGLSGSDLIYQVIARNESRLRSKIPNGFGWTGHVYYEQDPKTELTVQSTMTVADDDDVVINLYTDEKLVVARVHTGKYYTVDRVVDVGGFQVGDTVTSTDVLNSVKKFYNVSSMKMYVPADWEKIVNGGSTSTIPNFKVTSGDNIVDVYVTGSRISSSGTSYTADSSNPKTGDMIFAPVAVMGLSVSALAVLFFLNKKRAY